MRQTNQGGFAVIESILIMVIVALIGLTSFIVYDSNKKSSETLDKANTAGSRPVKQASPQISEKSANLSTYTSKYTGATIDFPNTWKARAQLNAQVKKDDVALTSPSGKIVVTWTSEILGVGSNCVDEVLPGKTSPQGDPGCPAWKNTSVDSLPYGHGLKIVKGISTYGDNEFGVYAAVQAPDSELVTSNRGPMFTFFQFDGHRSSLDAFIKYTGKPDFTSQAAAADFLKNNADFQTATQILSSLQYH